MDWQWDRGVTAMDTGACEVAGPTQTPLWVGGCSPMSPCCHPLQTQGHLSGHPNVPLFRGRSALMAEAWSTWRAKAFP